MSETRPASFPEPGTDRAEMPSREPGGKGLTDTSPTEAALSTLRKETQPTRLLRLGLVTGPGRHTRKLVSVHVKCLFVEPFLQQQCSWGFSTQVVPPAH